MASLFIGEIVNLCGCFIGGTSVGTQYLQYLLPPVGVLQNPVLKLFGADILLRRPQEMM
jgi:hypothetical protein